MVARTRRGLPALGLLLLLATLGFVRAEASSRVAGARVVYVHESRVYLAVQDSQSLQAGDRVTFRQRKRELAHGAVARLFEGEIAMISLSSGSLSRVKKLERIEVWAERLPAPSLATLRIGYPAASRTNLLFACERVGFLPPLPPKAYRSEVLSDRAVRSIRDPHVALARPWPDTLIARFFDDANDQEIALERGELDVAVFWPGELSRHMREQSRWQGYLLGIRSHGLVAAVGLEGGGPGSQDGRLGAAVVPDSTVLDRFNRELFRGDLLRWSNPALASRPHGPIRFEVDAASPGWREMQRFLDALAPLTTTRQARLVFVDAPTGSLDSLMASGAATPLFLLRCPVLCAAELRPSVSALDPNALVEALECAPRGRRP